MHRSLKIERTLLPEQLQAFHRYLDEATTTIESARQWLLDRGHIISPSSIHCYIRLRKPERYAPAQTLKVDRLLSEADRPAYEALLRNPNTRTDGARAWLRDRGYAVGRLAVSAHRRRFEETLKRVRESAQLAQALAEVAREQGVAVFAEGALTSFEQLLMERLTNMTGDQKLSGREMAEFSRAVGGAVGSRQRVEAVRRDYEKRQRRAAREAQRAAAGGADGAAVVRKVREILGIPADEEAGPAGATPPDQATESQ